MRIPETACREWTGAISTMGYGVRRINKKNFYVHRLAYAEAHGPIPEGVEIHHRCENPRCWNVEHLEALKRKPHMRRHAPKLNATIAEEIRIRHANGELQKDLAKEFGIHRSHVSRIAQGIKWG